MTPPFMEEELLATLEQKMKHIKQRKNPVDHRWVKCKISKSRKSLWRKQRETTLLSLPKTNDGFTKTDITVKGVRGRACAYADTHTNIYVTYKHKCYIHTHTHKYMCYTAFLFRLNNFFQVLSSLSLYTLYFFKLIS